MKTCRKGLHQRPDNQTQCLVCKKKYVNEWHAKNKDKVKANLKRFLELNPSYDADRKRIYTANNLEKERARKAKWQKENLKISLAKTRRYQLAKLNRTPKWADLKSIREFYINCPAGYEVDHIIPLQGKTVSGLHTLSNLQYLPIKENRSKGNKFS